jgi:ABC-2 type transport system ATP-binding protein
MDNYAIDINNLNKIYSNNFRALHDVNLKVSRNSIFGLLGPNGSGKSTLINILAGLTVKNSGQINILGTDFDQNPSKIKYLLGIVPQEIALDTFLRVQETLGIHAGYFGLRPKDQKTNEILKSLALNDKAQSTPRMLSGGMKRRLLIAKAMVHSPPILILDEPTAGVDIELREQLWNYVRELKERGTTIILTTHYLEEAENLCDEIAFIDKGKIIHSDKKQNLLHTLGSKKLIIEFVAPITDLNISNINYEINVDSNQMIIKFDPTKNINDLLSDILKLNSEIKNISIESEDLEDIYRKYIKPTHDNK